MGSDLNWTSSEIEKDGDRDDDDACIDHCSICE